MIERTRNAGKLTEAAYWGKVRGALRKAFAAWEPARLAMIAARRPYTGPNKRQKFEVQCNDCKAWYQIKEIRRDHIIPVGSLRSVTDLLGFMQRLTPEDPKAFQMLCSTCHDTLTRAQNAERRAKKSH